MEIDVEMIEKTSVPKRTNLRFDNMVSPSVKRGEHNMLVCQKLEHNIV